MHDQIEFKNFINNFCPNHNLIKIFKFPCKTNNDTIHHTYNLLTKRYHGIIINCFLIGFDITFVYIIDEFYLRAHIYYVVQ